jgi:hypothetical protein
MLANQKIAISQINKSLNKIGKILITKLAISSRQEHVKGLHSTKCIIYIYISKSYRSVQKNKNQ